MEKWYNTITEGSVYRVIQNHIYTLKGLLRRNFRAENFEIITFVEL
jgi:hypothetical protein